MLSARISPATYYYISTALHIGLYISLNLSLFIMFRAFIVYFFLYLACLH